MKAEGLTASKNGAIKQLSYINKACVIALQETHCTTADKIVIPSYLLAGSVLGRKHGLSTFVQEKLKWTLDDQSLEHFRDRVLVRRRRRM